MTMTSFELAAPEVVAEKFQEGVVILNLETGEYFDIGLRAAPLLEALGEGICLDALKKALEQSEPGAARQAGDAVEKMVGFGLLRPVPAKSENPDASVSAGILAAGETYHIECHSDLAELIAADPVHDIYPDTGKLKA